MKRRLVKPSESLKERHIRVLNLCSSTTEEGREEIIGAVSLANSLYAVLGLMMKSVQWSVLSDAVVRSSVGI